MKFIIKSGRTLSNDELDVLLDMLETSLEIMAKTAPQKQFLKVFNALNKEHQNLVIGFFDTIFQKIQIVQQHQEGVHPGLEKETLLKEVKLPSFKELVSVEATQPSSGSAKAGSTNSPLGGEEEYDKLLGRNLERIARIRENSK